MVISGPNRAGKKVLVIGSGGREHALAWKLAQSPLVSAVFTAPGNYGTALVGANIDLPVTAAEELATWAENSAIDFTVVGPEAALAVGIVDVFRGRGMRIFGPTRAAARLESSKAWAKAFMIRHRIPTAAYREFEDRDTALGYVGALESTDYPLVIKIDGLASGKGVTIAENEPAALAAVADAFSPIGSPARLVIEQFLRGFEVSFLAISDGITVRPVACAHDYKHAHDGGSGPMTGGMGAYSPLGLEDFLNEQVMTTVIEPTIRGMATEGTPYQGILYAGLMLTADGPKVLEFNARFGDPETQVILPRWEDNLYQVLAAAATGTLAALPPFTWSKTYHCGVVLAAAGYPEAPELGVPIHGLSTEDMAALVFQGGVRADRQTGLPSTSGGRVLTVVGRGQTPAEARLTAYEQADRIQFAGSWRREDIGNMRPDEFELLAEFRAEQSTLNAGA
jgi:phosphoribosylamine--glycine ligase